MESSEIWTTIIIPLLIGPLFLYLKALYDNYIISKKDHDLIKYTNKKEYLTTVLNTFYWPLYLKLLSIHQLNYNIPIKNEFEYMSDESEPDISEKSESDISEKSESDISEKSESDIEYNRCNHNGCKSIIPNSSYKCKICEWEKKNNENITININSIERDVLLDVDTIHLLENHINILFDEALEILEKNIYVVRLTNKLNKNIIKFIKYCKIRSIILEGSIHKKYNIEYFGVRDNTHKLLDLIEQDLLNYQKEYNSLINNGP
tara:strand:- start:3530 stop:4315 length:786 start_codon:yes stop_codon:yes gene_type:complete